MLEIPESRVITKQLNNCIKGKVIKHVEANKSEHKFAWYFGNPDEYNDLLSGKTIGLSYSRGGMVEVSAEDCTILFADGATIRYYEDGTKVPKKHQLYMEFTDGTVVVATIQMYGGLWAFKEGENVNPYYLGACEKPSPLSDEFSYEYFSSLYTIALRDKSVKAFLATEQRVPGLGNGVLQDILFQAGIHPKRKMNTLDEEDMKTLYNTIKEVLTDMMEQGGRDTEKDIYGKPGGYMTYMSKKTYTQPCTKCGYEIHKESFLGGTIYYCDHCQKL